jgi:hypothetical protein
MSGKKLKIAALIVSVILCGLYALADVSVRGYYRKDGTYVQPHMRSDPDGNFWNNWTTIGNVNPYTGSVGTRLSPPANYGQDVHVDGHYRNGSYVDSHYRSNPDGKLSNNWSTKGNTNPYTGKPGDRNIGNVCVSPATPSRTELGWKDVPDYEANPVSPSRAPASLKSNTTSNRGSLPLVESVNNPRSNTVQASRTPTIVDGTDIRSSVAHQDSVHDCRCKQCTCGQNGRSHIPVIKRFVTSIVGRIGNLRPWNQARNYCPRCGRRFESPRHEVMASVKDVR